MTNSNDTAEQGMAPENEKSRPAKANRTQRKSKGRNISGIILLDKPLGVSSNKALQMVKRILNARKAGHTGSLDPLATGMLPVCLGEATKMSAFLLEADKTYRVQMKLGVTTTTGDAEGDIISEQQPGPIEPAVILDAINRFIGTIEQIPPMHSAIKYNGTPLYKLAHQGIEIERKPRTVIIRNISLLGYQDDLVDIEVECSKGTYIRTLVEDIGNILGMGAYVTKLRRLSVGPFNKSGMVTMEMLEKLTAESDEEGLKAILLPPESALANCPDINLSDDVAFFLRRGQAVMVQQAPATGLVKLYAGKQGFLGVGHILDDGRVAPRRLVNA